MGCQASKSATAAVEPSKASPTKSPSRVASSVSKEAASVRSSPSSKRSSRLKRSSSSESQAYRVLLAARQSSPNVDRFTPNEKQAFYVDPETLQTPLHIAASLVATPSVAAAPALVEALLKVHPGAVTTKDKDGWIPLHYAMAGTIHDDADPADWTARAAVWRLLLAADIESSRDYLQRNDIDYGDGGCTPLYRVLQALPDDFTPNGPTVEAVAVLREVSSTMIGNDSDGDKPLALLYRRFTRQFDLAEKFFAGDNSRPAVVEHRRRYKTAAGNTWRMIELLLRPDDAKRPWRIVHRAVAVETPPDLLRYIVETNAEDLTVEDELGNLPLHYAAKSKPPASGHKKNFPAFYTKYVVDELLYKFPEAASLPDAEGNYPLTLAVGAGKQWIGGGIKSLYDAHPEALKQINLAEHVSLQRALSLDTTMLDVLEENLVEKEEKMPDVIRDEPYDAIMLVQQPKVDVSEVVTSMWAHEEDAGVQMLGCVAISKMITPDSVMRIALVAVAAVVNAMKAHPNEVIVQEKACTALAAMAECDGRREVSFVASGAVAAIVGAMQAHVSDPGVQEAACAATSAIIRYGGSDRATIVASVSGLTALMNAIAAHPEVVGVQQQGTLALKELTEHAADANLPELPRSQTEPLLLAAKDRFPVECGEAVDVLLERLTA